MARITGTKRGDIIDLGIASAGVLGGGATDDSDLVTAGGGNDIVRGAGGHDFILGEGGNDLLFGDAGEDGLDGGAGDDAVYGGTGNDSVLGGDGRDRLFGDEGEDVLDGGRGDDTATGGAGADLFIRSTGRDVVLDFTPDKPFETLIGFEGTTDQSDDVPAGYAGLTWSEGFQVWSDDFAGGVTWPAWSTGTVSATNYLAETISFSSDEDFTLISLRIRSTSGSPTVGIEGWRDGVQVFDEDVMLTTTSETLTLPQLPVDEVRITGLMEDSFGNIQIDDIRLGFIERGDRIGVASQAVADQLLASARADGAGNTLLGYGADTLTLKGVDASLAASDWFQVLG